MKIYDENSLKTHVENLLENEGTVNVNLPIPSTKFVFIPPANKSELNNDGIGAALQEILKDPDVLCDLQVPTIAGNGIVYDILNWLNDNWKVWGISPNEKILLYKPGELHVFTLAEFGEYICKKTGCVSVGYSYPKNFRIEFEAIVSHDWEPSTVLGQTLKVINSITLDKDSNSIKPEDASTVNEICDTIEDIIWDGADYYICNPVANKPQIYVLPQGFATFLKNCEDICDVIISNTADHDLGTFIANGVKDIKEIMINQNLEDMIEVAPDAISMLQEVIEDGPAKQAVEAMESMLLG